MVMMARLKKPPRKKNKPKLKTDAPDPITPTKGDASSGAEKDINDMTYSEFDDHMSKKNDDPWW